MNTIAFFILATIFFINVCLAQSGIDKDPDSAIGFVAPAVSGVIASVQTELEPNEVTSTNAPSPPTNSDVETTASTPQTFATTSDSVLSSAATSTASSTSSTASTPTSSSSTTSIARSSSSTISIAQTPSATASSSHQASAKIGIGVGVPFGIIFVAIVGFLTLRHLKYKQVSRLRHHGIIAAAGLYPVVDESDDRTGEMNQRRVTDTENGIEPQGFEKDGVHEIQGTEIPAYSRELIGSPGVPRQELAMRRGSE